MVDHDTKLNTHQSAIETLHSSIVSNDSKLDRIITLVSNNKTETSKRSISVRSQKNLQKKLRNKHKSSDTPADIDNISIASTEQSYFEDPYSHHQDLYANYGSTSQTYPDVVTEDELIAPKNKQTPDTESINEEQNLFTLDETSETTAPRYNLQSVSKFLMGN